MISETLFTRNDYLKLAQVPLCAEMAVVNEWVVRDDRYPDNLLVVYAAPGPDWTIEAACSCILGAKNGPCSHALIVITNIKTQPHLFRELFAPRPNRNVAA